MRTSSRAAVIEQRPGRGLPVMSLSDELTPNPGRRTVPSMQAVDQAEPEVDDQYAASIVDRILHKEMSDSYMAYAMSVIMSRALPDVRDGLKPVQRRILFGMHQLNLQPSGPHRKCARVVGEVLGKYHPHGDSSVYDALVRMAQDFSLRTPLVDGHGNFGSIDPDPAAAMRYTECKLTPVAAEALLSDVSEDVVDFGDNFDGSEVEPIVLPARLPMLLLNGATGIAVGMATNCPPHNLGEIVDALRALLEDRDLPDEELFKLVPAPDFPTGGIIMGRSGARQMYLTGKGSTVIRAEAHVEPPARSGKREAVVVTQLPYGVSKNSMLERIAAMVNEKKLEGIAEIRDESSMEGIRIVFEIKRDSEPLVVLNRMYKNTNLQNSFSGNLMAVTGDGKMPQQLTLRAALLAFLDFRVECLLRRSRFRLRKAQERLHIVDGLLIAQSRMDEVVKTIRTAKNVSDARMLLESEKFGLSKVQAEAILSMQLRRLTALERETLEKEGDTLRATIAELNLLISDRPKLLNLISEELASLKDKYGTPRRSRIGSSADAELTDMDMTANEPCIIIKTSRGYMKRLAFNDFQAQNRGGRGKAGMSNLRDNDVVVQMLNCQTHDTILCISTTGVAYALPAYKLPQTSRTARGVLAHQLLPIESTEVISTILSVDAFSEDVFLVLLSRNGYIKKTPLAAFGSINARGLIALSLEDGDDLLGASLCRANDSVLLCSEHGQAVRFRTDEQQLRSTGRQSRGVRSMSMKDGDKIADFFVIPSSEHSEDGEPGQLLAVTKGGFGKRMRTGEFKCQGRGGKGVIAIKFKNGHDRLLALSSFPGDPHHDLVDEELLLITDAGIINRQRLSSIRMTGRTGKGVLLQKLDKDDKIASAAIVPASSPSDDTIED